MITLFAWPCDGVHVLGFRQHASNMSVVTRPSFRVGLSATPKGGRRPSRRFAPHTTLCVGETGRVGPLLVVGSANIDYVWRISRMPALGETLDAESLSVFPGGKVQH